MFSLESPRSGVRPIFLQNRYSSGILLSSILVLTVVLATTACSTLNASGTPSIATEPIAMSANLPMAVVGTSYNAIISVSGGIAPYTFVTRNGTLPPGLSLNASTGAIFGMPKTVGSFNFTIGVTDKNSAAEGAKAFAMSVHQPAAKPVSIEISPTSVTITSATSHQFLALVSNASTPAVTWKTSGGTITSAGLFTAPTVHTSTTFHLTATSVADPTKSATAVVNVDKAAPPTTTTSLTLSNTSLPEATQGLPYSTALKASGGKTPYSWKLAGSLPSGFAFNSTQAAIGGITSQTGAFSLTATVTDAAGQTASQKL